MEKKKFVVEVTEVNKGYVTVEAIDENEACELAEREYNEGFVDMGDLYSLEFDACPEDEVEELP